MPLITLISGTLAGQGRVISVGRHERDKTDLSRIKRSADREGRSREMGPGAEDFSSATAAVPDTVGGTQCRDAKLTAGLTHAYGWSWHSFAVTRGDSFQAQLYSTTAAISATIVDSMIIIFIAFTCYRVTFDWLEPRAISGRVLNRPGLRGRCMPLAQLVFAMGAIRLLSSDRLRPSCLRLNFTGLDVFNPPPYRGGNPDLGIVCGPGAGSDWVGWA